MHRVSNVTVLLLTLAWACVPVSVVLAEQALSDAALIEAGKVLYREGRSTNGEIITALVQYDVPVSGAQVTCRSCHGISGMGTIEGGEIPAALAGPLLFAPEPQRQRPAYDEQTLARALRGGVDSAGRLLDPLMPRFPLVDADVQALSAYLRQLGAEPSPGVADDSVRIATVIGPDVEPELERAVLQVFEKYVSDRNRMAHQRLRGGRFPDQWKEILRSWEFDVWKLNGPSETWAAQLKAYQLQNPTFALVGGMTKRSWQPVHDFCESEQMPCLLPDVNLPPYETDGDYSFYFSHGLALEADIIASALESEQRHTDVLVLTAGGVNSQSVATAVALESALVGRGGSLRVLDVTMSDVQALLSEAIAAQPDAIVLLLSAKQIQPLVPALSRAPANSALFFSSTLLDNKVDGIPQNLRERGHLAHLIALPGESDSALTRFRIWARNLEISHERHQALAYFACVAFTENYKHMQQYLMRDYFLDRLEHSPSLTSYLPFYTRAMITPGQRVLSRGGYLIDLSGLTEPVWLVP